jgi:phosphoribosylformylglycinamidine synthase
LYLARIYVTLKPAVNDPQGRTVLGGLKTMGYSQVADVRVGKYLELRVDSATQAAAEAQVQEMCQKLLANPVIEEFRIQVEELAASPRSLLARPRRQLQLDDSSPNRTPPGCF